MGIRVAVCAIAPGMTLVGGAATVEAVAAPTAPTTTAAKQFSTALEDTYLERVVFIQLRLFDLGHKAIVVDGHYGNQTRKIVKNYQRKHSLIVDGTVGKQTWKSLFGLGEA